MEAVNAVVKVFEGQPFNDHISYLRDALLSSDLTAANFDQIVHSYSLNTKKQVL